MVGLTAGLVPVPSNPEALAPIAVVRAMGGTAVPATQP